MDPSGEISSRPPFFVSPPPFPRSMRELQLKRFLYFSNFLSHIRPRRIPPRKEGGRHKNCAGRRRTDDGYPTVKGGGDSGRVYVGKQTKFLPSLGPSLLAYQPHCQCSTSSIAFFLFPFASPSPSYLRYYRYLVQCWMESRF